MTFGENCRSLGSARDDKGEGCYAPSDLLVGWKDRVYAFLLRGQDFLCAEG
jgi:hypothetical protein